MTISSISIREQTIFNMDELDDLLPTSLLSKFSRSEVKAHDWAQIGHRVFQDHNISSGTQSNQSSVDSLPTSPCLPPLSSVAIPIKKDKENNSNHYKSIFMPALDLKSEKSKDLPKSAPLISKPALATQLSSKLGPKEPRSLGLAIVSFATDSLIEYGSALQRKDAAMKLSSCARALVQVMNLKKK